MKKFLSILTVSALVLSLTGCRKNENETSGSESNVIINDSDDSEFMLRQLESIIADFPEEFPLPDGTVGLKKDFKSITVGGLPALDYAFIRYAEPIFYNTIDDPEVFDPDTLGIESDLRLNNENAQWIRVKSGDILENGLKIVSAQTSCEMTIDENGVQKLEFGIDEIRTDGEITLEGIFEYYNGSSAYGAKDYYYSFYPDCSEYKIPVTYGEFDTEQNMLQNGQSVYSDGGKFFRFQFKNEAVKSQFSETTVCKAKLTYKDVVFGRERRGEIVFFEFDL